MISRENAEHYIWGDRCDGWLLVHEQDRSIIHEKMPPGTCETRHFHKQAKQFFFVLTGTMTIEAGGVETVLRAHEGLNVPPNLPHQVFNKSGEDLEFLVISQPRTTNDRYPAPGGTEEEHEDL